MDKEEKHTKLGLHAANVISNRSKNSSKENTAVVAEPLNNYELRVLNGIMGLLSDTNFKGNASTLNASDLYDKGRITKEERDLIDWSSQLPRLVLNQEDIYTLAGCKKNAPRSRELAMKALKTLTKKTFCISYRRASLDDKGGVIRDLTGEIEMEDVSYISALFSVGIITDKAGEKRFEVVPSPLFLDRIDKYYMKLPSNWMDEVKSVTSRARIPTSIYNFIFVLRVQYELKSRKGNELIIKWNTNTLIEKIEVPKTYVEKGEKGKINKLLQECFDIAKKLSFVESINKKGDVYHIKLNEEKFKSEKTEKAKQLLGVDDIKQSVGDALLKKYQKLLIDNGIKKTYLKGSTRLQGIDSINQILDKGYDEVDILCAVSYALTDRWWCTKVTTPTLVLNNIDEIVLKWRTSKPSSKKEVEEFISLQKLDMEKLRKSGHDCYVGPDYFELSKPVGNPVFISFEEKGFYKKVSEVISPFKEENFS